MFARFPNLKIAYSEGQIGWIPYVLERADVVWEENRGWGGVADKVPEPPSELFREHVYGCFFDDAARAAQPRRTSASTTSPTRPTTRTPTRPGRTPAQVAEEQMEHLDRDVDREDRPRQRDPHAASRPLTFAATDQRVNASRSAA